MDSLINWLWQGVTLTALVAAGLAATRRLNAATRYRIWWGTLTLALLLPVLPMITPQEVASVDAGPSGPLGASPLVIAPAPDWVSLSLLTLWLVWVAISLWRTGLAIRVVRRARRRVAALPQDRQSALVLWQSLRHTGRAAALVTSDDVRAGAVLGLGRPVIAVSPSTLVGLTDTDLDAVIVHEYAHVQRRDDLARLLQLAVQAIAGWHPAIWWALRAIDDEREVACDDWVVALTGNAPRYARCLTTLAADLAREPGQLVAPAISITRSRLSARITRLLERDHPGGTRASLLAPAAMLPLIAATTFGLAAVKLVVVEEVLQGVESEMARDVPPQQVLPSRDEQAPARVAAPTRLRARASVRVIAAPDDRARVGVTPQTPDLPSMAVDLSEPVRLTNYGASSALTVPAAPQGSTAAPTPALATLDTPSPRLPQTLTKTARFPWGTAADAGVAIGSGSRRAAVKTAGLFARLGKSVAGTFSDTSRRRLGVPQAP